MVAALAGRICHDAQQQNAFSVRWRLIGGADARTFEQLVNAQLADMSTASSRILMRLFTVAFLLLLPSDTIGRDGTSGHGHHSPHPGVAKADHGALLATTAQATPERKDVDTAPPQLLASEASVHVRRVQCAPAPTRVAVSVCSYERTTGQAARPPPFQA